eukprot:6728796-Lingulodinium_polyedra.AAC.1
MAKRWTGSSTSPIVPDAPVPARGSATGASLVQGGADSEVVEPRPYVGDDPRALRPHTIGHCIRRADGEWCRPEATGGNDPVDKYGET